MGEGGGCCDQVLGGCCDQVQGWGREGVAVTRYRRGGGVVTRSWRREGGSAVTRFWGEEGGCCD